MATISSAGIGSGLDINSLVTQLVAAERQPAESRLDRQEGMLQAKLSAFGTFKSALSSFQDALENLTTPSAFQTRSATSGNEQLFTASASSVATAGTYDIMVSKLAQAHSLASATKTATTDTVGTGTITVRFGAWAYDPGTGVPTGFTLNADKAEATITIDGTNNSLQGVRDAINNANIGVTASIINDGTGYRLVTTSKDSGADNAMEITVSSADGLDGFLSYNMGALNLTETAQGINAQLKINGLPVTSETNTVSGAIEGVTLNLKSESTSPAMLTIAQDKSSVTKAVNGVVTAFNSLMDTIDSLSSYDAETQSGDILMGESTLRNIESSIRQEMSGAVASLTGPFTSLADIGITTQLDGKLKLDDTKLQSALDNHFDDVAGLFAAQGKATDSLIQYSASTSATLAGTYAVHVDQLATQGSFAGDEANNITALTLDALNNTFSLKVDGVQAGTITLTAGSYNDDASLAGLAAQMQTKINGDSALADAGLSVSVAYDTVNDKFVITSDRYGSVSTVEITTANSTLGLDASGVQTAGLDVAGTINGVAALGSGQYLIGATGDDAEGLRLLVTGGAAPSDRGTVSFSRGVADRVNTLLTDWLASDGIIDARTAGLNETLQNISDQRDALDRRMELVEARYRNQFVALDTLLSQMQSTSSYLAQQLASLPGAS